MSAGLEEWRYGRFEQVLDHPPLAHLLLTLPLAHGDWDIIWGTVWGDSPPGFRVRSIIPDPVALATRARLVNVLLGVLLGILLWLTARKLFSVGTANVAIALFAFSPSLIAHFSIVTTDGVATLMAFATAVQVIRWRANPSWAQTTLLGVLLGLLLLSKLSTPPLFCLALILILILKPNQWVWSPRRWNWYPALVAAAVAGSILWAGYFFHVSRVKTGDGIVMMTFPNRNPWVETTGRISRLLKVPLQMHLDLIIPAGEYAQGIEGLLEHNHNGHQTFLLGEILDRPKIAFYGVVALLKWPSIVLLLFVSSLVLFLRGRLSPPPDAFVLLLFPAVYMVFIMSARITMGERHFLPIYPFVLLIASAFWEFANGPSAEGVRSSKPGKRALVFIVLAALIVNAADALRFAPDYLSYLNILIPNRTSYRYLSDSNLDWGQGLLALRQYQSEHPNEQISLAYFGDVEPAVYGIKAANLREGQKVSGTVVVSATHLSGQFLSDPSAYRWVTKYPIKTILNHSLFVFAVPSTEENSTPVPQGAADRSDTGAR
ncbi:MAG: glycosyltransferase family 39 protein [Terriglobales bacterium]